MTRHVVVSGASGLIGTALVSSLRDAGISVTTLVRRPPRNANEKQWSPGQEKLAPEALAGADVVVSLGGASVGRLPWTSRYRSLLLSSRIATTRTIATAVRELGAEAPAFVSASAVGFYGSAPGEEITEKTSAGQTFLARLCVQWEDEAKRAGEHTRVALLRTAPVLESNGVLKPMIQLTKFGLAGPLGRGSQIWPWISLVDEVRAIRHVVDAELSGPVNLTGPTPASANTIGKAVADALGRPFWLPAPAWALRLGLTAAAADSLLLADADVRPVVLLNSGFRFTHSTAQEAVAAAL